MTRPAAPGADRTGRRLGDLAAGLTSAAFGAGWASGRALPEPVAERLFRLAADVAVRRRGPAVVQLARNLLRVLGDAATPAQLAAVTRAAVRSYARYWKETFRLPAMDLDEVAARATAETAGLEHLDAARAARRGAILALPHCGNWDAAAVMIAKRYGGLTVVVERLEPESLYRRFVAYRELLGMEVVPLDGGPSASQLLRQRLAEGGVIALLADRDLSAGGIPVSFFGEPARMPAGPAMLAARTGADLCPTDLWFTDTGWTQDIHAPMPLPGARLAEQVRAATQRMADSFAAGIAEHPADWHMMQPLWTADLAARPGAGDLR